MTATDNRSGAESAAMQQAGEDARSVPGIRSRVLAGAGAHLLGQGVTAGIQIVSLPLFLHFWDTGQYGKWVMLSAVPTYFSISDGGLIPVAANKISMLCAGGQIDQANKVFQSALALLLAAIVSIAILAGIFLGLLGNGFLDDDSRFALWLMVTATLISMFGGLFEAGFRAYGNYAQGVLYGNGIRMLEFAGLVTGLVLGRTFTATALGMLVGRCAGSLMVGLVCRQRFTGLHWGFARASVQELGALTPPALAYMAFPLGNALNLQAITLVVGGLFGNQIVATFTTYRTLSRLALQLTATFSNTIGTEFSRLFGAGDAPALRRVYHRAILVGSLISVVLSISMLPSAPLLLQTWTHGKIGFDAFLFTLFALATLVGGLTQVPRTLLLSTNRHGSLSAFFLGLAATGVVLALALGTQFGLTGAALAMITVDAGMLYLTATLARRLLNDLPGSSTRPRL